MSASDPFVFPAVPDGLPPGRVVTARGGRWDGREVLWVSDERQRHADQLWSHLYNEHGATGLYPLLLDVLKVGSDGDRRPWRSGELGFVPVEAIDVLDPDRVLQQWWRVSDDPTFEPEMPRQWPGLASPGIDCDSPDSTAGWLASILATDTIPRLGLIPAQRGADAVALCGWQGPMNHTGEPEKISAVLRSWEERFGARVVMLGFDTLALSVAAPPRTHAHARQIAVEHVAFCPDNLDDDTLDTYATALIDHLIWEFWWD
ncbi:DUF4253 domain-containing protein [Nocardia sp. NPDC004860]|uniref:DUF4253 domain-containing protein n=1 Tax=Nocardia sp. NPDC004860 TaxID=3154557 RepID=UPI0033A053C9